MNRTERFYKIEHLLQQQRVVTIPVFLRELEVSLATFKRDLEYLRDRLHAPIVFDRALGGYRFDHTASGAAPHELPGLWFNASEIHALLAMQELLRHIEPGLLAPQIEPLKTRLTALLARDDFSASQITERIKLLHTLKRPVSSQHFQLVASATLRRQRLRITHFHRANNETLVREISPQQLVYYRNNWYLDAWCHLRKALRSFAVDAITAAELLNQPAREVGKALLKQQLEAGYGIFGGRRVQWATLRFSPERARWVSQEVWHPQQQASTEPDGHYRLRLPYSDDRELLMDILKHGAEVEVLSPAGLRTRVRQALQAAIALYPPTR